MLGRVRETTAPLLSDMAFKFLLDESFLFTLRSNFETSVGWRVSTIFLAERTEPRDLGATGHNIDVVVAAGPPRHDVAKSVAAMVCVTSVVTELLVDALVGSIRRVATDVNQFTGVISAIAPVQLVLVVSTGNFLGAVGLVGAPNLSVDAVEHSVLVAVRAELAVGQAHVEGGGVRASERVNHLAIVVASDVVRSSVAIVVGCG